VPGNPSGALAASIGSLRWLVTLYRRDQAPSDDLALTENLVPLATVHADVQPTYASTFYQSTQVDTPITHMINVRWQDYPATIDVVVRSTKRPSDGQLRSELFRVRRTKEVGGRKRFLQMECELEHSRITPDDSDATRNDLLTEPYDGSVAAPILPGAGTIWDDGATSWDALPPFDTPWDVAGTLWDGGATAWDGGLTQWDSVPGHR
jgi:head-tail adaptor